MDYQVCPQCCHASCTKCVCAVCVCNLVCGVCTVVCVCVFVDKFVCGVCTVVCVCMFVVWFVCGSMYYTHDSLHKWFGVLCIVMFLVSPIVLSHLSHALSLHRVTCVVLKRF